MVLAGPSVATAEPDPGKYAGVDWTEGCIAPGNRDMSIVWSAVDNAPQILP